jgi:hypothetical protein
MLDRLLYRLKYLVTMRDVHLYRQGAPAEGLDLLDQIRGGIHVPQAQNNVRTRVSQGQRNGAPQTAGSASDQGYIPI